MSLSDDLQFPGFDCGGNDNGLFTVRAEDRDNDWECLHCSTRWSA